MAAERQHMMWVGSMMMWGQGLELRMKAPACLVRGALQAALQDVVQLIIIITALWPACDRQMLLVHTCCTAVSQFLVPGSTRHVLVPGSTRHGLVTGTSRHVFVLGSTHHIIVPGGTHDILMPGSNRHLLGPGSTPG